MWGVGDVKLYSVKAQGGKTVSIINTFSENNLRDLRYQENGSVFKTKSARVNRTLYATGCVVCLCAPAKDELNFPSFGKINEIIITRNSIAYLRVINYDTLHFDSDLVAYAIECVNELAITFLPTTDPAFFRPYNAWIHIKSDKQFISLRHVIL